MRAARLHEAMGKLYMWAQSSRHLQEFPWVSVDLQVPIHLCKEIIKSYLPSKVLKRSFSFPLVNESWEGWQLWERKVLTEKWGMWTSCAKGTLTWETENIRMKSLSLW